MPSTTAAAPRAATFRLNFGSHAAVKRVFWLDLAGRQAGCQFHDLYGPDFCDLVGVGELEATDAAGRLLTADERLAALRPLAQVVTGGD